MGDRNRKACVSAHDQVTTGMEEEINRSNNTDIDRRDDRYDETEVEMIEDDTTDPLPETLDLIDVISEALVLTMPPYPRKEGIEAEAVGVTEPGKSVMTDEDARPFARLAALRAAAENKADGPDADPDNDCD